MLRVTFVMEQHIGHFTYYQNLRRFIDSDPRIQATWVPVRYAPAPRMLERLPLLPAGLRGALSGRREVRSGLARMPADVFFFNTQVPAALAAHDVRRKPYVVATDLTPVQYDQLGPLYGHRRDRFGPARIYKHRINTVVLRGAARLAPWSTWARDSLIADYGVDPSRIAVVPPGVDLSRWTPARTRSDRPFRILFVGGDFHRKGGQTLLQAFQLLPQGTADLVIVTRSPIAAGQHVQVYHDMQPNTPGLIALYQTCDVFVLPTDAEAFGIAAVEAAAAGLPVIASRIGGLTDIVCDGETGFLIAPGDIRGMAECLRQLAANHIRRSAMGEAARHHAEMHFDAARNATHIAGLLVEAAQG